jgi:hypothetical protein
VVSASRAYRNRLAGRTEKEKQLVQRMAALLAVSALFIAGCNLRPRPFSSVFGQEGCRYKDSTYSHGSTACQSGTQYRCDDGQWIGSGTACAENLPAASKGGDLNGNAYSTGSVTCQSGTRYRCDDGAWRNLGLSCIGGSGGQAGRACMYSGATVATQSTICKSGITFRCEDGEWRNLGTACQ